MRSRRAGLRRVERQFRVWRRRREGRRIPSDLWDAAVALLAEHEASEICRVLGLNPTRFKVAREARTGATLGGHRWRGSARAARPKPGRSSRERGGRRPGAFVELPPVTAISGRLQFGAVSEPGTQACRVIVESPTGTLTVTIPAIGPELAQLVRRCVAAALGESPAA